ncbi:GrpB family protein [Leptolyngbya sp. AN02str]|uniref:GrpB family protein n=1 Tax=Leptolyngbya sp. AN02str TaxID=3423363 RepID=UPI003D31093F
MTPEPIVIVEYDATWPVLYQAEQQKLTAALAPQLLELHHIGSTSVQGLAAKPIIDMLAGARSLQEVENWVEPLRLLGYTPEAMPSIPDRRYFFKSGYHLHIAEPMSHFWQRHLRFRDYLRSHPSTAQQYEALKRRLAQAFRGDRSSYTQAKSSFIESVIQRALEPDPSSPPRHR